MPLKLSRMQEDKLKGLLGRAFTKKQLLVLRAIEGDESRSITSAAKSISEDEKIPLSTVKLDLKILEKLGLVRTVDKESFKKPRITKFGKLILQLLSNYNEIKRTIKYLLFQELGYLSSFKQSFNQG